MKSKDVVRIVLATIGYLALCGAVLVVINGIWSLSSSVGLFVLMVFIAVAAFIPAGMFSELDCDCDDADSENGDSEDGGSK